MARLGLQSWPIRFRHPAEKTMKPKRTTSLRRKAVISRSFVVRHRPGGEIWYSAGATLIRCRFSILSYSVPLAGCENLRAGQTELTSLPSGLQPCNHNNWKTVEDLGAHRVDQIPSTRIDPSFLGRVERWLPQWNGSAPEGVQDNPPNARHHCGNTKRVSSCAYVICDTHHLLDIFPTMFSTIPTSGRCLSTVCEYIPYQFPIS